MATAEVPPEVASLLADHRDDVRETTLRLRRILLEGHPALAERVRTGWHSLNYRDPDAGFVCALFPMAERVQLVFERGAMLPDPSGLLTGSGRQVRALEFPAGADPDPAVIVEYLDLAVEVGTRTRSRRP